MQKWEYKRVPVLLGETVCLPFKIDRWLWWGPEVNEAMEKFLNDLGTQGWELTGTTGSGPDHHVLYFKRPKP